jgi:hypothetical protein
MATLKNATPEQRAQYLKALDIFGPEAHQAGVEVLSKIDKGEALPVPSKPPAADHVAKVDALALPPIGNILKCLVKCAPNIPNWIQFAVCVATCLFGGQ